MHYLPDDFYLRDDACSPRMGRFRYQIFAGRRRVELAAPAILALRRRHALTSDVTTDPSWFVSRAAAWGDGPLAVVLEQDGQPAAAVLLRGRKRLGVPTGVVRCGNPSGDGAVVAALGQRVAALEMAAGAVLGLPWVHTVMASVRGAEEVPAATPGTARIECTWFERKVGTDLSLNGGFEGFLLRFPLPGRRDQRHLRRRAERELGLVFVPDLLPADTIRAVEELHGGSAHPAAGGRSLRLEAAIRQTPGSFAMGVRDMAGRWMSYLSGWRQKEGTFVEWQLDRCEPSGFSSHLMQTCFLEHEAAHGVGRVAFVGGAPAALGCHCAPDRCLDLLATRVGVQGRIARKLATRLCPQGQVLPLQGAAVVLAPDQA